jgi:hypothetical protein
MYTDADRQPTMARLVIVCPVRLVCAGSFGWPEMTSSLGGYSQIFKVLRSDFKQSWKSTMSSWINSTMSLQ